MTVRSLFVPTVFSLLLLASDQVHAGMVCLALGDSATFGNDESRPSSTKPNFGDQGFVKPFADFLGTLNGGVRPQVTNLAISGELSSSFFSGTVPSDWTSRNQSWNLNYPKQDPMNPAATAQNSLMLSALGAIPSGSSVYVTLEFGSNDFAHLVNSAAWQSASPADQQAMFGQLVNQIALNYETALTEIRTLAPGAHILLPGFSDNLVLGDPGFATAELAIGTGNQILQQIAPAFGATYVDFYSVINGHVLELTNHDVPGGGHLNEAGYAAVAMAMDAAAVPEPASLVMVGIGLVGMLGYGWRRRAAP